jgi:hypothetical protein
MSRFLILSLSLIFTVTSFAAPGTASSQGLVIEYVKKTKLSQKSRTFSDLVRNSQTHLSKSDYQLMKDLSDKMPGLVIPKVQINKIKNNRGGEDLQILTVQDGQSATIDITQEDGNAVVRVVSSINKKPITLRLNTADGSAAMYEQLRTVLAQAGAFAAAKPSFEILKSDDIEKLTIKEKKQYFRKLQDLMEAAEKVQASQVEGVQTGSIWHVLVENAFAAAAAGRPADGKGCIIAGFASTYKDGACGKGDSALPNRNGGEIRCNTAIFGEQSQWVSLAAPPGACTAAHRNVDSAFPRTIRNKEEFDTAQRSALTALEEVKRTCEAMKTGNRAPSAAQASACVELRNRYADLAALQCKDLQKSGTQARFPSLNCRGNPNDAVPVPTQPPVVDNQCDSKGCPRDQLKCPEGQRRAVDQCPGHFRCVCDPDQEPVMGDGMYERDCGPRGAPTSDNPPGADTPQVPPNENKKEGGIAGWMWGVGGLVIGGLLAWLLIKPKKKMIYVPNPYAVPNPIPNPIPVPVPVPVPVPGPPYTPPVR